MMKRMKKAVSFLMAVCLLAGNSYVNTEANTSVTMTEWTEVPEAADTSLPSEVSEPTLTKGLLPYLKNNGLRVARAEDETTTQTQTGTYVIKMTNSTGENVQVGETLELRTQELLLVLDRVDASGNSMGIKDGTTVDWVSGNTNVLSIQNQSSTDNSFMATIVREGPGYAMVTAWVWDPDLKSNFPVTCYIKVGIEVIADDHWKEYPDGSGNYVLVLEQGEKYQVNLKYQGVGQLKASEVKWAGNNRDGVITVGQTTEDAGIITAVGAGACTVTITTDTVDENDKPDETTFEVIVRPSGMAPGDEKYLYEVPYEHDAVLYGDSFYLYSNAQSASENMDWEVYRVLYDGNIPKKELISSSDTSLLYYTIGETSGVLEFQDVKAGTYQVVGYANKAKYGDVSWNKVVYNVVVDLNLKNESLYMNVDDVYNVVANSNIPEDMFVDLISIRNNNPEQASLVETSETGLITAKNKTTENVVIQVSYRQPPINGSKSIYAPSDKNYTKSVDYTVTVIDGLSLNSTLLTLYTGATYQLLATVTDRTAPVVWSSSDPTRVKVDQNGLITALKETNQNEPVRISASQTIDGIERTIVCKVFVQPAITEITLDPAEITLEVDEYATIKANIKPSGISGTSLKWISSDAKVVEVSEASDLTVVIKAVSGGSAVLTAINAENIVVGHCKVTVNQPATSIKLNATSVEEELSKGSFQLKATLLPENTTNGKIIWASQNTKVATVDEDGLVTYKKAGTVTISAQSEDNPMLITYCHFTILDVVSGVKLDQHDLVMYVGESERLTYLLSPTDAANKKVIWTSFDTSVVSVDKTGKVTAKGPGTTQIMLMTEEGSYYDLCTITVEQYATGVKMNYTKVTMNRGDYFDMEVTLTPITSTDKSLTWESLNPKVVTVSSTGRFTARAVGTAIVMVKTQNGSLSYCEVTVLEPVTSLKLDPTSVIIDVGEKFTIDPVFTPAKPSNTEVKWTTSDKSVVEINALGEITGVSRGTAVITCETVDGGYSAFCLVTVENPEIQVTINPDNYRLGYGKSYTLEAVVTSHGKVVENVDLVWSSTDESVCTVDRYGKITGIDYGYATITAAVDDGDYEFYGTCEVRVVREVTSIKLNYNYIEIVQGQTASLRADVQPSNATYNTASFVSDDTSVVVVDEDGLMTGITPGETWVHANAKDNSGKTAACFVKVIAPIAATGVTVSDKEIVLIPGESKEIIASIKPSNSTDDLIWTSGNEYIATVNGNGKITAHTTGTTTVTVMTSSGKTATVNVIVLGLSRTTLELPVYTQYSRLTVDGATSTVRWDVEDLTICEVKSGVITARKVGTTYVTATVNGRTLRCKVTVTANTKKK